MRNKPFSLSSAFLLVGFFMIVGNDRAHAYLDPGTGSWLFQCLIGAALAGAFFIKAFWAKIRSFFARLFAGKRTEGNG